MECYGIVHHYIQNKANLWHNKTNIANVKNSKKVAKAQNIEQNRQVTIEQQDNLHFTLALIFSILLKSTKIIPSFLK